MGLFDKLFGKSNSGGDSSNLTKTDQMLNEDLYWQIVQDSIKKTSNQNDQEEYLISRLQKLSPTEIIGFRLRTDKLLYDTYTSDMWCAGYIMNEGCSDDGFEYFRCWVISRGKGTYYKAKENADYLINEINKELECYEFESFWHVALTAFENKTGKDLHDYIDDSFKYTEGNYQQFEFTWKEKEPETMRAICPKLFHKMEE